MLSCKESKFCGVQIDKTEPSVFVRTEHAENNLPVLTETSIQIECQENHDDNSPDLEDESSDTEKHMSWNEVIPPKPPSGWRRSFAQLKMTWTMIENRSMAEQGNNEDSKRETKIKNSEDEPEEGRNNNKKSEENKKCEEESQEKKKESKNNMEQEDHLEPSLESSMEVKVTECLKNGIEGILQYDMIQTTNNSLEMTNECTQHLEHEQKLTEILHKCKELFIDYQVEHDDAGTTTSLPED